MTDATIECISVDLPKTIAMLTARAAGDVKPVPLCLVDKPWTEATDALGGGLWPGLYVVVGATGCGKTQLGLSLALGAALQGCPVGHIGIDIGSYELIARCTGLLASKPWSALYTGKSSRDDMSAMEQSAAELQGLPFFSFPGEPLEWPADWIEAVAHRLTKEAQERNIDTRKNPPLVVLDYLQLVGAPQDGTHKPDIYERIELAVRHASHTARKHGIAIVAISSTARHNTKSLRVGVDDAMPDAAELIGTGKESPFIELLADGVFVVVEHTDAKPSSGNSERLITLALAKTNNDSEQHLRLAFDGSKFRPVSDDELKKWSGVCKRGASKPRSDYKSWQRRW